MSTPEPLRDGDLMVVQDGSMLPNRCPVCNAPAYAETVTLRFGRRRYRAQSGLFASLIGLALDRLSDHVTGDRYTGPVAVQVRLCSVHAGRRRWLFAASWGLLLVGAAGLLLTITDRIGPWIGLPFLVALMAGTPLVIGMVSGFLEVFLRSRRFDDRRVWIAGACPEFLACLPEASQPLGSAPVRAGAVE